MKRESTIGHASYKDTAMDTKNPSTWMTSTSHRSSRPASEEGVPEWETKLGKTIFYLTCALALWFFYWLNGIQCPC